MSGAASPRDTASPLTAAPAHGPVSANWRITHPLSERHQVNTTLGKTCKLDDQNHLFLHFPQKCDPHAPVTAVGSRRCAGRRPGTSARRLAGTPVTPEASQNIARSGRQRVTRCGQVQTRPSSDFYGHRRPCVRLRHRHRPCSLRLPRHRADGADRSALTPRAAPPACRGEREPSLRPELARAHGDPPEGRPQLPRDWLGDCAPGRAPCVSSGRRYLHLGPVLLEGGPVGLVRGVQVLASELVPHGPQVLGKHHAPPGLRAQRAAAERPAPPPSCPPRPGAPQPRPPTGPRLRQGTPGRRPSTRGGRTRTRSSVCWRQPSDQNAARTIHQDGPHTQGRAPHRREPLSSPLAQGHGAHGRRWPCGQR